MTSINLQFMLFLKPLSVHSRSIVWRPDGKKRRRGEGERETSRGEKRGEEKKKPLGDRVYFSGTKRCGRDRLIVL